jgi:hypothetical protein
MSRLTGNDAKGLMEAYAEVYAPQELTEEQVWEEVETWVNSLLEEGYDLSDYTWEEMYNLYEDEYGRGGYDLGRTVRGAAGDVFNAVRGTAGAWRRGFAGTQTSRQDPISRAANAYTRTITAPTRAAIRFGQGLLGGPDPYGRGNRPPAGRPGTSTYNPRNDPNAPGPHNQGQTPGGGNRPPAGRPNTPPAGQRPSAPPAGRPNTPPARSSTPAGPGGNVRPAPAAAPAGQTGDKAKDMATWAKANPSLAVAAAEKARIRGTQQTDNPLMKDMRSRLPMASPSVQSPAVAKLGPGNQSLVNNPNALKAATPATPAKPTPAKPTNTIKASYDPFDTVIGYLLDEGYADTEEAALAIMANMSEGWVYSIVEAQEARNNPEKYEREQAKKKSKRQRDMEDPHTGINSPAFREFMRKQTGRG